MSHVIKTKKANNTELFFLVNVKQDDIITDSFMKFILL